MPREAPHTSSRLPSNRGPEPRTAISRCRRRVLSGGAPRAQTGGRPRPDWRPSGQTCRPSLPNAASFGRAPHRLVSVAPGVKDGSLWSATLQRPADEQLSHGAARGRNQLTASGCWWERLESRRQNRCRYQPLVCCGSALSSRCWTSRGWNCHQSSRLSPVLHYQAWGCVRLDSGEVQGALPRQSGDSSREPTAGPRQRDSSMRDGQRPVS